MNYVRPKKHLGQHFLKDDNIAKKIAQSLSGQGYTHLMEIGAGTGILTKHLLELKNIAFKALDVDEESIAYLLQHYPEYSDNFVLQDFLISDLSVYHSGKLAVIGNFPYNISSQILFHVLKYRNSVVEIVGMFQREVAIRIASGPGSKEYGILSVLMQTWYDIKYLFTLPEQVFSPPPKVKSSVLQFIKKPLEPVIADEKLYFDLVKTAFNQRRKTLRNAINKFINAENQILLAEYLPKRAEQLHFTDFVQMSNIICAVK